MDRYPPYTETEIAEFAAVRRPSPFMVWPAGAGGLAILAERSGSVVAGPFSTPAEAFAEVDRLNAAHQAGYGSARALHDNAL